MVVVTGASSGVGRATAQSFARQGARIGLLARRGDGLEGACRDVEGLGGEALAVPTDVADAGAVEAAATAVEQQLGPIDVWVNCAMTSVFSPFKEMELDDFRRVTEVTYLGFVYGTKAALRRMLPRDEGSIVQVGSALAYRGIPLQSAYCGAKHAIQGFTESVRTELLHDKSKVRITMVQLPGLNTPQFDVVKTTLDKQPQPAPPFYQPEVAAETIVWAADHDRRELWVGGVTAATLIANKLAPGLLDRYLARNGYKAQVTDEPIALDRPHNLWEPVPGDQGAHGRFGHRARPRSVQAKLATHRPWLVAAAVTAVAARTRGHSRRP